MAYLFAQTTYVGGHGHAHNVPVTAGRLSSSRNRGFGTISVTRGSPGSRCTCIDRFRHYT